MGLYLPVEYGGQLERVLGLIESLIEQSELAGLTTGRASTYLIDARDELMSGNYKRSYQNACNTNGINYRPVWAQSLNPMDMIVSGCSMSLFQAWQPASMMAL